ncbi:adipogenesis regulatory factor isoform X1 [Mauremys reevesii]|uniref:adipogenesis regulatory factor isoform X1 n=1 Tax=Mauremys reevesii TaxID=260615 RepID=UPI00193FA24A|nr:adipogenesis regulatory factor isoform X1 [Mauremys reevesii]
MHSYVHSIVDDWQAVLKWVRGCRWQRHLENHCPKGRVSGVLQQSIMSRKHKFSLLQVEGMSVTYIEGVKCLFFRSMRFQKKYSKCAGKVCTAGSEPGYRCRSESY